MIKYYFLAILATFISSISQMMLKKATFLEYKNKIREYLNTYVIGGYFLMFASMLCMILAYKGLEYKIGTAMESIGYLFVLILSYLVFNEKITKNKIIGNILIVVGIIVFCL